MAKQNYFWGVGLVTLAMFATIMLIMLKPDTGHANPSSLITCASTGSASTTQVSMTAGTATTTLTCNVQTGTVQAADSAYALVQFTGSSTASTLKIALEYSQDGIDWYADDLINGTGGNGEATTTRSIDITGANNYTWNFSSTTVGGNINNAITLNKVFNFLPATKQVRAVFTMPNGSLNGLIWAQIIIKRELN